MIEEEEERRVDEILVRLHEAGMHRPVGERSSLARSCQRRYRNRQGS